MILNWLIYYQKQKTLWVRQFTSPKYGNLKKTLNIVRQFASTCLSVKTPQTTQITLNEHQTQPLQLQTTSCPQTHHTKHLSTRCGPAHDTLQLVLIAYSQKFYLICSRWRRSYGALLLYLHPFALCMRAAKALARLRVRNRLVWAFGCS